MALLLGPAGVGLIGLYSSIQELAQSIAGMGITSSGVRQIAHAAASGDETRVARTVVVLARTALLFGGIGAGLVIAFRRTIAEWTFDSPGFAFPVALLSLAIMLRALSDGQGAVLQGLRRIGDLARFNVLGAVIGSIASILLVYILREDGIVPMLVAAAGTSYLFSWYYRRKIVLPRVQLGAGQVWDEASDLLKLGFGAAVEPLRWICIGMALRVVAWPMGYIILAKNARQVFLAVEIAAAAVHVSLAFLLISWFGVAGATMAFCGLYLWHSVLVYAIVRRMTGFRWSDENTRTGLLFLGLVSGVFGSLAAFPDLVAIPIGLAATALASLHSARAVCRLVPLDRLPGPVRRALVWGRFAPGSIPGSFPAKPSSRGESSKTRCP
jgi:O-antigen/teichoic acid export membrane protein